MYVGAQRVRDDDGKISLTLYLYLHGGLLGPAEQGLLSDVRWISQRLPGQLAYQQHEGREGGRVVLSFLEVSGPDDSAPESLDPILALAARGIASGARRPVSTGAWGADFFAGPDVVATEEFENLREHLTTFIREHGTRPPSRALTILVTREPAGTAYTWDDESRERIRGAVAEWQPARPSVPRSLKPASPTNLL